MTTQTSLTSATQPWKADDIQVIAFDLDGTLVDSAQDIADAINAMRESLAMPALSTSAICSFLGCGLMHLIHSSLTGDVTKKARDEVFAQGLAVFAPHYLAHVADKTQAYPEVVTTLALLKKWGYPLVVVTNKPQIFADALLDKLGLRDYFSLVLGGDALPEKKPHPAPLLHVCSVFNIEPKQCLMVGDSRNDALAAQAAACPLALVRYGYHHDQIDWATQDIDCVLAQFVDLLPYFKPN